MSSTTYNRRGKLLKQGPIAQTLKNIAVLTACPAPSTPPLPFAANCCVNNQLADQKLCLPGPTPPPDYSRMVHVSGFPSEAKTDAVIRPLASVNGLGSVRFHWIDDTSGVAECKSSEAARVLLLAGAAARQKLQAAAGGEGVAVVSEAKTDVDPIKLSLGDLCIGTLESLTRNGVEPGEKLEVKVDGAAQASAVIVEDDVRGKKRPRDEENGGETGAGD